MRSSGEDERWTKGVADRKLWKKKKRKSGLTMLYLTLTPVQQGTSRKSTPSANRNEACCVSTAKGTCIRAW